MQVRYFGPRCGRVQSRGQWFSFPVHSFLPLSYLNGIFGGFDLSEMREDELKGIFDSIQLGGREKIVQGEIFHQRRVVINRI